MERLTKRELINGKYIGCNIEIGQMNSCPDCNDSCMYGTCKWQEKANQKLKEYEDLEEQGLLLKLKQASVNYVVDKLFSHNEIISLWRETKENGLSFHKRIWYGMAWDIPEELKNCKFVKIFGTIPESIAHADIINIEVVLSEEAEKALEEMERLYE